MKLKDFKKWLNSLTEEQLEQPFLYNSGGYTISGEVKKIEKAKKDLYFAESDDLCTIKELKEMGYEKEDIEYLDVAIPKGTFFINID